MRKSFTFILAAAPFFALPTVVQADDHHEGQRVEWRQVPAGRGATQSLPFVVRNDLAPTRYALTGQNRRIEYRQVPAGRGATQSLPFEVTR